MRPLINFLATGGYIGYVPVAPGTAGSVLGLLVVVFVFAPLWIQSPAGAAEKISGVHDDPHIVLDEILGMAAAIFLLPTTWFWLFAAFALFRLLDIFKPWPASFFNSMNGGAGVMLDDLAAALYANLALQLLRRIF